MLLNNPLLVQLMPATIGADNRQEADSKQEANANNMIAIEACQGSVNMRMGKFANEFVVDNAEK